MDGPGGSTWASARWLSCSFRSGWRPHGSRDCARTQLYGATDTDLSALHTHLSHRPAGGYPGESACHSGNSRGLSQTCADPFDRPSRTGRVGLVVGNSQSHRTHPACDFLHARVDCVWMGSAIVEDSA